jgi:hypothetical protein
MSRRLCSRKKITTCLKNKRQAMFIALKTWSAPYFSRDRPRLNKVMACPEFIFYRVKTEFKISLKPIPEPAILHADIDPLDRGAFHHPHQKLFRDIRQHRVGQNRIRKIEENRGENENSKIKIGDRPLFLKKRGLPPIS